MKTCRDYALGYISRYPKTSHELREKLTQKGYEHEKIDETIEQLEQKGFLDDRMYAELYLASEVVRKGKPLFLIQQKLYHKGIEKAMIQEISDELETDIGLGIQQKLEKEINKFREKGLEDRKIQQKLQSRGYAARDIMDVLERLDDDTL